MGKTTGTKNTTAVIERLAEPLCKKLGYTLWDVTFEKEGSMWILSVMIDSDAGIGMADCEAFTAPFNEILDAADPIDQSYVLEVGGPGLGRLLRKAAHFEKFLGCDVRVKLFRETDGRKEFTARLVAHSDGALTLDCVGTALTVKTADCAYVRLADDADLFSDEAFS
ncbi:MAG: ribosome maturation factor RimP [Oscillospiraceae bacterium]